MSNIQSCMFSFLFPFIEFHYEESSASRGMFSYCVKPILQEDKLAIKYLLTLTPLPSLLPTHYLHHPSCPLAANKKGPFPAWMPPLYTEIYRTTFFRIIYQRGHRSFEFLIFRFSRSWDSALG